MYKKFVELLQRKDVTPYKVSKETGVSQQTLSDWKNGKSVPKVDKLQKIADYFNVPIDWFTNDGIQVLPNFRIYKSVELFFYKKLAVVLQQLLYNPLHKYCIQYAGSGHYFANIEDVYAYLQKRWSSKTRTFTENRLLELLESAPVLDIDPGTLWRDKLKKQVDPEREHDVSYEPSNDIKIVARHLEEIPSDKREELIETINKTIDMYKKAIGFSKKEG